ncbi:MAG: enoyl-CoA hydratase/isomerase family protein [Desulfomonile tiedjei]|uniref:Enoyl-CoA hydratase/isomerase family protein n=1 Tax=Desulfomonile tiedjei TaxID=2358 RepID=A0A9D6Z664_9BACT|nr:enoyl-CoA hydratase/isomerase family protein [Desulfomonile tiedjei]
MPEETTGLKLVRTAKRREDRIGIITMDTPPLNVFTREMKDELRKAFEEMDRDPGIAAIILTGSGERAFNVGSDIKELKTHLTIGKVKERARHENDLNNYIQNLAKPTIAAINGYALGGGLEIALACDMRVCAKDSKLGTPEIKLAVFPGGGGTERLPALIGYSKTLELILTGKMIGADEAMQLGLVNRVATDSNALDEAMELARSFTSCSLAAIKMIKKVVRRGSELSFDKANELSMVDFEDAFATQDAAEGINAFLEKRIPLFVDA